MILIQNGYECDFEMNIFINIFFGRDEEGKIYSDFTHENDVITVKTKIEFEGKEYFAGYTCNFSSNEDDKRVIKKIYSCACTKSFVRCAKKIRDINLPWGVMSGIRPAKSVRKFREAVFNDSEIRNF